MKKMTPFLLVLILGTSGCRDQSESDAGLINFKILEIDKSPLVYRGYKGTENNKYGFEGGRMVLISDSLHWLTTELVADPFYVKTKLAHWRSKDGIKWERISTLYESSGEFEGKDKRAALWAPIPVYNEELGKWNLFYVSYKAKPDASSAWYRNHEGRIWSATSQTNGLSGIGGPYAQDSVILMPGVESQPWEGLQGVDSFFPFEAQPGRWLGLYGSTKSEIAPPSSWQIGLAEADKLAGVWKRAANINPLNMQTDFVENPIVFRVKDDLLFMLFDGGYITNNSIGFSYSEDGKNWSKARFIDTDKFSEKWWETMRTPLGLFENGDGTCTIYFTAFTGEDFASLGRVKLLMRYNY